MIQGYSKVGIDKKHKKEEKNYLGFSFYKKPGHCLEFTVNLGKITHQNVSYNILLKKLCIHTYLLSLLAFEMVLFAQL